METPSALTREIIDEDIQIVRATLATLSDDVSRISAEAGRAFHVAMEKIDEAHEEILRSAVSPKHRGY